MKRHWRYALSFPLAAWAVGNPVKVPVARPLPPSIAAPTCPGYAAARAQLLLAYGFRVDRPGWAAGLATHALARTKNCGDDASRALRRALKEVLPAEGNGPHPPP